MALLFELAKKMEMSSSEGYPRDDMKPKPEVSLEGSSPKSLELTPTRAKSVAEKVDGSEHSKSQFSEPEWEPDINLAWTTRQVTEELWRSWSDNGKDFGMDQPSNSGDNEDDLDDLPPPPPPPPLPPPPENVDMFSLSTALGFSPDGDFSMNGAGPFMPTMWPYPPMGFMAPSDFYGTFATYDQVNESMMGQTHYWHESTFNTAKRDTRRKHESLIDLAVARQHLEQQLQLSEKQGAEPPQKLEQPKQQEQTCEKTPNFCTFCGGKIQAAAKFCMFCGAAVSLSAC